MKRLIGVLLFVSAPAWAADEPCFELGGQGIAPCATPHGHVAVESNLIDWQRSNDGTGRTDVLTLGSTTARVGVGGNTELRVSTAPLILTKETGDRWRTSVGDLTLGAKHQFGASSPIGLALQVTLPTGTDPAGQQTWSADAILPMQFPLSKTLALDLTPMVSAAANSSGNGRHFAWSVVAGGDIGLSETLTLTADLKRLHDEDPVGTTNQTSASLSLGWQVGERAQFTIGEVTGLDRDAPEVEAFVGVGYRF